MPPVTLVVKTPSLKLSDLIHTCEASTSVFELKTYLQSQYPPKPTPEEQKLIYQGRLLEDSEILKDFLRDIEKEQRHTLHLVYTLKRSTDSCEQTRIQPATEVPAPVSSSDDGLRLRHSAAQQATSPVPAPSAVTGMAGQHQPEWLSTGGQFPVWANHAAGVDALTQQMLWWQQTYAQQYWSQYMNHLGYYGHLPQDIASAAAAPHAAAHQSVPPQPAAAIAGAVDPNHVAQQQQQNLQQRPPLAAVGGVAQDDDAEDGGIRAARDWLDWIYVGSRLAILLGVMYYYSSLPRFMLVTMIVAGIYLYQKAIHQRRNNLVNDPHQINPQVNNNADQAAGAVEADGPPQPADRAPADPAEEPLVGGDPAPGNGEAGAPPGLTSVTHTAFSVAVNVFIGFFTSLIPEVPAPEALN